MPTPTSSSDSALKAFPPPYIRYAYGLKRALRDVARYRSPLDTEERLQALLWTWPIHRALLPKLREQAVHLRAPVDRDLEKKKVVLWLVRHWYPYESLDRVHDTPAHQEYSRVWALLCKELDDLGVQLPEDEAPPTQLAYVLEAGWGAGEYDARREMLAQLCRRFSSARDRARLCAIAERARDQAFLYASTVAFQEERRDRLAALRAHITQLPGTVAVVKRTWRLLLDLDPDQIDADYPAEDLPLRDRIEAFFTAAREIHTQQALITRCLEARAAALVRDGEAALRRRTRGKPPRAAWLAPARQALQRMGIAQKEDRETLLWCWGLAQEGSPRRPQPARARSSIVR